MKEYSSSSWLTVSNKTVVFLGAKEKLVLLVNIIGSRNLVEVSKSLTSTRNSKGRNVKP